MRGWCSSNEGLFPEDRNCSQAPDRPNLPCVGIDLIWSRCIRVSRGVDPCLKITIWGTEYCEFKSCSAQHTHLWFLSTSYCNWSAVWLIMSEKEPKASVIFFFFLFPKISFQPPVFHFIHIIITFRLRLKMEQFFSVMRLRGKKKKMNPSISAELDCTRGSETNLEGAAPQPRLPFPEVESPSLSVHLHHQRAPLSHVILTCAKSVANSSSNVYTALAQACKAT